LSLGNDSYPLKELNEGASVFSGFAFKSKDFVEDGIPVVKIKNIQNKSIDLSDIQFFSQDNLNDKHEKFLLKNNDVLIAMTGQGSLGRVGRLKLDNEQLVLLNQRVGKFIADEKRLHLNYLYHVISSDMYEKILFDRGTGSGQPNLSPEIILGTEIPMPDFNTQKKIAMILDNIDDLINLNKKINKNLLQLSKVIFKNWFVEFEPFGGVQPNNWKICTLEDVCDLKAGGDKPDVVSDEITDTCSYPIYSNGLDKDGLYGYTDQAKIFEESVTVSARGTIGFVCLRHIPYVPIVRLVSVIPKKEFISAKYLYLFLDRLNIMGTGTTQQQLTIPDFKKTEILVPTLDIIKSFTNYITPIFEKIWIQEEEIKKLQKLRDTLLPKLMSGEIDVSKINCDLKNFIKRFIKKFKSIF